ncbi:MAG: type II/IV secretion system protein [Planctomycetes bacterium]|nr:type II/IV secretion system protein [Planctomycetota bacterium]
MKLSFGKNKDTHEQAVAVADKNDNVGGDDIVRGLSNLYSPESETAVHVRDVVDVLVEMGRMTEAQLEEIRGSGCGGSGLEHLIVQKEFSGVDDILEAKAQMYGHEFRPISAESVDLGAFEKVDLSYIKTNRVMPVVFDGETLVVATDKPGDVFAVDDIARHTGKEIKVVICRSSDIENVCQELDKTQTDYDVNEIMHDMGDIEVVQDKEEDLEDLEQSAGRSPVIKFVNYLLSNAVHEGASDIHIEPKEKHTKIRLRIDGILFDSMQAPANMHPAVVSRIKIMSNLDISERRLPQDGKISVIMGGRGIDLRISILPTSHGEKVVIRILDSRSIMRGLDKSGMESEVLDQFLRQVTLPHGILLVTGPTGSGKSTTLYSALGQMDGNSLNISTVEDPVEYDLEFCNQVQAREQVGLTFEAALRSLLRQDPDIIMIGEIRDSETAKIAVQAALTGHLVLSTLHTNDAPSSISRLVNVGVDPYLIAASLNGVLAQRLVRKICEHCKEPYDVPDTMKKHLEGVGDPDGVVMYGAGCDKCRGSGYAGRVGIYELLLVDDDLRAAINKDASVDSMKRAFARSGRNSLFDDGMLKVKQGLTTIEEVLRVTEVFDRESLSGGGAVSEGPKTVAARPNDKASAKKTTAQKTSVKETAAKAKAKKADVDTDGQTEVAIVDKPDDESSLKFQRQ